MSSSCGKSGQSVGGLRSGPRGEPECCITCSSSTFVFASALSLATLMFKWLGLFQWLRLFQCTWRRETSKQCDPSTSRSVVHRPAFGRALAGIQKDGHRSARFRGSMATWFALAALIRPVGSWPSDGNELTPTLADIPVMCGPTITGSPSASMALRKCVCGLDGFADLLQCKIANSAGPVRARNCWSPVDARSRCAISCMALETIFGPKMEAARFISDSVTTHREFDHPLAVASPRLYSACARKSRSFGKSVSASCSRRVRLVCITTLPRAWLDAAST